MLGVKNVVWGGLNVVWVVWWWFGANMANQSNKNAFKCVLQVLILSQTQPLGIKHEFGVV